MKVLRRKLIVVSWRLLATIPLALVGCGRSEPSPRPSDTGAELTGSEEPSELSGPFVLGDDIAPFDPPTLEELDSNAEWIDNPVKDALEMMRESQAVEGPPPVSVSEALKLRNDSPENNQKILRTLGQLAPPSGEGVDYGASLVRHVGGDLKSTNPLLASSVTEFEYLDLTGFGYLSFDREFNYFAPKETVVSWQTSKDHMYDKIVLRDDLVWSDGKPLTAHDIEFTYRVIMSKQTTSISAVRSGTDKLRYVKAYDDQTVVFFHKEALATNTTNIYFPIIPKHIYESTLPEDPLMTRSEAHSRLEDKPVVGGAYELVKRVRNQEFVVRRRDSYYMVKGKEVRKKPYFAEVRVKAIEDFNTVLLALKAGDIEQMELRPEQWTSQTTGDDFYKKNTKVTEVEWVEFHFCWNIESPLFADKRVRWAMSYAMDYDELIGTLSRGLYQQGQGTFHPTSWMFPENGPPPLEQDLDKAEELLEEAGWVDSDGDGVREKMIDGRKVPFEFSLLTYQTETGIQTGTLLKEVLAPLGIVCNVKPTEFTVLVQSALDHKFEALMGGWGTGTDPDTSANIWVTNEGRNYGQYSNKRVDELFEQGRREFDKEKRAKIYSEIHQILWEDQPYTWLFYRNSFYAFNKKLRGYNFSPRGPFNYAPGFGSIYAASPASP